MIALILTLAAEAACPAPVSPAELDQDIEAVIAAFRALDGDALDRASAGLEAALPCVAAPLDPALAARWHAAAALVAIGREDTRRAEAELRALARAPDAARAALLLSVSGGARQLYEQARLAPSGEVMKPRLSEGERLWVDGQEGYGLSRDMAALLQLQASQEGGVQTTSWGGGRSPEQWRAAFGGAGGPRPHTRRLALAGGAGALALGAGAVYAAGLVNVARYQEADATPEERLQRMERSHPLSLASAGLGLGALGLGAVAVVRW